MLAFLASAIAAFSVTLIASGAPSAPSLTRIAAGQLHTCAITGVGGAKCWGTNLNNEVGNGVQETYIIRTPVDVVGLTSGVRAVAAEQGLEAESVPTLMTVCDGWPTP